MCKRSCGLSSASSAWSLGHCLATVSSGRFSSDRVHALTEAACAHSAVCFFMVTPQPQNGTCASLDHELPLGACAAEILVADRRRWSVTGLAGCPNAGIGGFPGPERGRCPGNVQGRMDPIAGESGPRRADTAKPHGLRQYAASAPVRLMSSARHTGCHLPRTPHAPHVGPPEPRSLPDPALGRPGGMNLCFAVVRDESGFCAYRFPRLFPVVARSRT